MACDCLNHDPNDPTHKPCAPCLAARMLPSKMVPMVMSGTPAGRAARLGAAADDVTTLQKFFQQLSSTQTFPTNAELTAAQQAVTNLSTEVPNMPGAPAPTSSGSSMTVSPAGVILMIAGTALVAGGVVYIAASGKKRKRR